MEKSWDVIIVGARVAGSSLAILLGRLGKRVLILDKAPFPSDTLSTHHLSHVDYLKQLDVLEEVERSGLRKINRMRTYIGDSFVEGPRSSYTIIPRRNHLDQVLLNKALEFPSIQFREQCSVRDLLWEKGRVSGVAVINKQGDSQHLHSDIVVGADGKNSNIAHWTGAEEYKKQSRLRPVFYGYYRGVQPLLEPTTEIFLNKGRIGFLFPMEDNMDCLGLEIHPEEFQLFIQSPQESFEKTYGEFYGMDRRLKKAELQGKLIGTPGVPNFFRKPYGDGWAIIGDAGHSKDPSTGLGINDAFMQSFLLAEAIHRYNDGEEWFSVMEEFQAKRDQHLLPGFQLTLDYIQSLREWTINEEALFQSIAANPMVWNKLVPSIPEFLKKEADQLLYGSIKHDAKQFGFTEEE